MPKKKPPAMGNPRGVGRPRNDEVISPLAERPDPGQRVPTVIPYESFEVLQKYARRMWMSPGTAARVILNAFAEVGPDGVLDFKKLAERVERDREALEDQRRKAFGV